MNPLLPLANLAKNGLQPMLRQVWIGLGFRPAKSCGLAVSPDRLPTMCECRSVVGLDVIVTYHGNTTRYSILRSLCHHLHSANPRRLQVIDLDRKRIAFLKLGVV